MSIVLQKGRRRVLFHAVNRHQTVVVWLDGVRVVDTRTWPRHAAAALFKRRKAAGWRQVAVGPKTPATNPPSAKAEEKAELPKAGA